MYKPNDSSPTRCRVPEDQTGAPFCHIVQMCEPLPFWIVVGIPHAIAIRIVAAPAAVRVVVIQDDNEPALSEGPHSGVEHIHIT